MLRRTLPGLAVLATLALGGCSGGSADTATDPAGSGTPTSSGTPSASGGTECSYPSDGRPAARKVTPPPAQPTVSGMVHLDMKTGVGVIGLTLNASRTPCTVNSFVSLARQSYFDQTPCHRLTTAGIFVLQCGDPTGTGSGGPGYSFPDELKGNETYPAGTLAMANAGPDTNGSQFFIVYKDSQLPPAYTVFGKVDAHGLQVVRDVAKKGTDDSNGPGDGKPNEPVEIQSVTVR